MAELKKTLGFLPLIALGVAGVIGSSWIYTNSAFFEQYGAGGMIFGLAIGTLLAACVALAYAELTTLFPRAGGEVVYSFTILGRPASFLTGCASCSPITWPPGSTPSAPRSSPTPRCRP